VDKADIQTNGDEAEPARRRNGTGRETLTPLVVIMAADHQDHSIDDHSFGLGRGRGIGDAEGSNGRLPLAAPHEQHLRVELGYGRVKTRTDQEASRIIEEGKASLGACSIPAGIRHGMEPLELELRKSDFKDAA